MSHSVSDNGLAGCIAQGSASGEVFRTAPFSGLGQRLFLLHDGRANDLTAAIAAHATPGSEANGAISNFNALAPQQKQDLIHFLQSL